MEANLKDSAMPLHSAPQQENDWIQRCPLPHPACKHLQDKDLTPSHLPWNGCLESTGPYSKAALHHLCDCKCLNSPTEAISALQQGGADSAMVENVINVALGWTALQLWSCCCLVHGLLLTLLSFLNSELHYMETLFGFPCLWALWCSCHRRSCYWDSTSSLTIWKDLRREEAYFLPFVDPAAYISLFSLELEDTTVSKILSLPHLLLLDEEWLSCSAHVSAWK